MRLTANLTGVSTARRSAMARPVSAAGRLGSALRHPASRAAASAPPSPGVKWLPMGVGMRNVLDLGITRAHADVPAAQGLFNPANDRDACGVGFVGELSKKPTRACVKDALKMLVRM